MAQTAANVTYGKPKTAGAIWRAPAGTTLPTDATSDLDSAFVCLGYCSEDGLTNEYTIDTDSIQAWGGDKVLYFENGREDTFGLKLIESLNPEVLKAVYNDSNVSGTLDTGITVKVNSTPQEESEWVVDMVLKGGVLKRIVIPAGKITELGEINYVDNDAVGYEITVACVTDTDGNYHYEYIQAGSSTMKMRVSKPEKVEETEVVETAKTTAGTKKASNTKKK